MQLKKNDVQRAHKSIPADAFRAIKSKNADSVWIIWLINMSSHLVVEYVGLSNGVPNTYQDVAWTKLLAPIPQTCSGTYDECFNNKQYRQFLIYGCQALGQYLAVMARYTNTNQYFWNYWTSPITPECATYQGTVYGFSD